MSTLASEQDFTTLFPDEVVTYAYTRMLDVPDLDGQLALITIDNGHDHTKPSTFGPAGLASLNAALDEAFAAHPAAIAVTGKPFVFAAGADLAGMSHIDSAETARRIADAGHQVFRRLTDSSVPTFAFVNGAALGGGLELALSCHYRTVASNAGMIAFPECFLGLFPGWGGTQLLPNLIGADAAVTVIIENALNQNRMLDPRKATDLGIFDVVLDSPDYLEESLRWAVRVTTGQVSIPRSEIDRGAAWDAAITRARGIVDGKTHGASPGAEHAVELIDLARRGDLDAGYAAETEALTTTLMSDELRAGLYAFDLTQKRAKKPAGAPDSSFARDVTKVGVVGAGLMASQLAVLFVRRLQVPVVLTDIDQERIDNGIGYVHAEIDKFASKGRITEDEVNRLKNMVSGSLDKAAFADADFVIEAVFEETSLKQRVFAEVESHVSPECVLATNTSALSVSEIGAQLTNPDRLVGFHFFNPVAVLPLLEIVRGAHTDDATLATAFALAKKLKKSAVLVADAPAFVVNRVLTRMMSEVIATVDEGTDFEVADRAVHPLGLPMSPMVLLQLVGPAVAAHVNETLHEAFPDRFGMSDNVRRFVESGKSGIWQWDAEGNPTLDPEVAELWSSGNQPSTEQQVRERVLRALAEEILIMLDEGVVAEAADIDLCMILGAGWPFWLGGITPYLDRSGISRQVNGVHFLEPGVASVPNGADA